LGKVLGSGRAANVIRTALQGVGEGFYLPDDIVYENVYDGKGGLVSHGEAYTLLRGLRLFGDRQNRALLDSILGGETEITDILQDLADAVARKDTLGNSLSDYLTESVLLRSVISTVVLDRAEGMIAVPTLSLEKDAEFNPVRLINKAELKEIFDALPNVVSLLLPLAEEELSSEAITALLEDETLNGLLENGNKIVEGTVANALIERLRDSETVIIPRRLLDFEEWVTYGEAGELRKTLASIRILQLDVTGILEEGISGSEMIDIIRELERAEVEEMLESDVMHYTISKLLEEQNFGYGEFRVIIPASSRVPLYDDVLEGVISKNELIVIFSELKELGLSSEMSAAEIVTLLVKRQELINDSRIISASVVNFLCTNDSVCDALNIPERYLAAATLSQLEKYDASNPWRAELPALITALDEIFDISAGAEFSLDRNAISEKMNELLRTMNKPSALFPERTKLDVCYDSAIIRNDITVELDEALTGAVADDVLAEAKPNGYYSLAEIRALSDAADLFGLDFMSLTGSELTEKIKAEMMRINEPREDYEGRTALEVIYPSAIIRRIMTDELDKSLSADVIDGSVRDGLKTGSVYPEREIAALIDGIQAIGISSVDAIDS
ncbi:MAG: hypothetical protein K2H43_02280, partial [Clostridia bacterium]|nr:hypothetical protein [Clostridia bacterium]